VVRPIINSEIIPYTSTTFYFFKNLIKYQGYTRGGTQIQQFESVGKRKFAYNNKVSLVHKSNIYVTTIATNSAGLIGVAHSPPILVDLTEPDITEVNDGSGK